MAKKGNVTRSRRQQAGGPQDNPGGHLTGGNVAVSNELAGRSPGEAATAEMARIDEPAAARSASPELPDPGRIAARAYEIYQARGGGHGHALDDWLQAERELQATAAKDRDRS